MTVGRIAAAVDDLALLAERALLGEAVGAVQLCDVLGDHRALRILPRPLADAIARVDGRCAVGGLRREIGAPGLAARSGRLRQCLAVIVGAGEPAEIAAIADAVAGQEEAGVGRLRLRGRAGESRYGGKRKACRRNDSGEALHLVSPCCFLVRWHQHITATIIPAPNEAGILAKEKGAAERTAAPSSSRCGDQLVCWIAESSQSAPRRRAKVHTSVASIGVSLPETRRPVVRSRVLSTSENRIATLAKSVSPSRQASARSPCSSLTSVTLLTSLRALFSSRSLEK